MVKQKFREPKSSELDISIERIIFSEFGQKRHGWATILSNCDLYLVFTNHDGFFP